MDIPKENNDASIQLSKKPMNEKALAGLAAGRAKLQELNKAKADAKSVMLREAIAKKAVRSAERDAKLLKEIDLAIADLSEGEEEAPPTPPIVVPKAKPSRVAVVPKKVIERVVADEPPEPIVVKKPKKKVVRYVEESSSEEEEIVYVKREKKTKAPAYKAPPQQQIMFY
jgi:hypothetical protein